MRISKMWDRELTSIKPLVREATGRNDRLMKLKWLHTSVCSDRKVVKKSTDYAYLETYLNPLRPIRGCPRKEFCRNMLEEPRRPSGFLSAYSLTIVNSELVKSNDLL